MCSARAHVRHAGLISAGKTSSKSPQALRIATARIAMIALVKGGMPGQPGLLNKAAPSVDLRCISTSMIIDRKPHVVGRSLLPIVSLMIIARLGTRILFLAASRA